MNPLLLQLMEAQGEIKIRLLNAGLSPEHSHVLAADLLDYIVRSPIVTKDHLAAYTALNPIP